MRAGICSRFVDDAGTIIATVEQTLYLRKPAAPAMNRSQAAG